MNWFLPFLALLHLTAAQTDTLCTQATATINSPADVTQLSTCEVIQATVVVGSEFTGDAYFNGPKTITGDLIIANVTGLTYFISISLTEIGGTFQLDTLPLLESAHFDELTRVSSIIWTNLPTLDEISLDSHPTPIKLTISNTNLPQLPLFGNGSMSEVDINNNAKLDWVILNVSSIAGSLSFSENGKSNFSFPNLVSAANFTARDCPQIDVPLLSFVNGSLGLYDNSFSSFSALKLTSVGNFATGEGSLAIESNAALKNLSIPLLKSVGGTCQIAQNDVLATIGFPALVDVGGALILDGNFSTPDLPSLGSVKGAFELESTNTAVDCSGFQKEATSGVIQGSFACQKTKSSTTGTNSGSSPTNAPTPNNPPASSGLSTGAKIGIGVAIPLVVIIVALGLFFAWRKGYKLPFLRTAKPLDQGPQHPTQAELPLGGHNEKSELPVKEKPSELSASAWGPVPEPHELDSTQIPRADG
ncbi:hypothetical protein N431DRAFT_426662 [Stipitochalara longipes BDJ]|nr:hypothetical protein N431DRAFT_426662 [Stipitochalara longipes BDJ]